MVRLIIALLFCGLFFNVSGISAGTDSAPKKLHVLEVNERLLHSDDGLILGNGDLSVSVYQSVDTIIWRFGKGDVWDRRLDLDADPKPLTIDELAYGLETEGWKCGPYGGKVEALRGTKDQKRMWEVCQGTPPSYMNRPYPCPKPVGELALQLPPDQMNLEITQRLVIEEGRLEITCVWPNGPKLTVDTFIPPKINALVVRWRLENWNKNTAIGVNNQLPVWFKLYRWSDPSIQEFAERFAGNRQDAYSTFYNEPIVRPLNRPLVVQSNGLSYIVQRFPADPLFQSGFCYRLVPFADNAVIAEVKMPLIGEAHLNIMPHQDAREGWLMVSVPTSSDPGGDEGEFRRVKLLMTDKPSEIINNLERETIQKAKEFWSKSSVEIADPLVENLWYEILHIRRSAYRSDTTPPGLFLPSTVNDYSLWHGDYHTNYNFQSAFFGDYASNHFEIGDAYFRGMDYFIQIGRKIARDYYHSRGVFIQLTGYPIHALDDPLGIAPMGRMAYMTGWAVHQYWWRYLYSLDKDWLRKEGYPAIRDAALFYTDFLKKGPDGLYHAFPSNQGEDGFTGNPKDATDQPQVINNLRYSLRTAIAAGRELNVDENLRVEWLERLEHLVPVDDTSYLTGLVRYFKDSNPPEFGWGTPYQRQPKTFQGESPLRDTYYFTYYFGQFPIALMGMLREGKFIADRDFPAFRDIIRRWRHPNGLPWAMSICGWNRAGAWTESLGIIGPLQEMMFQSWGGIMRIFPAWPDKLAASFKNFRAEGAFLVSASWSNGMVEKAEILSEAGGTCRFYSPWEEPCRVFDRNDKPVPVSREPEGIFVFETKAGETYRLSR